MQIILAEAFLQAHSVEESFISKDFKEVFSTSKRHSHTSTKWQPREHGYKLYAEV